MSEAYEGVVYEHVRKLEKDLKNRTPASKADIEQLSERLRKIEHTVSTLLSEFRQADDRRRLREAEETQLAAEHQERRQLAHH